MLPVLYAMWSLSPDLKLGLSLNSPFGLTSDYQSGWIGRYHALKSTMTIVELAPNLAWRLNPSWSIGGAVVARHVDAELSNAVDFGAVAAAYQVPGAQPGEVTDPGPDTAPPPGPPPGTVTPGPADPMAEARKLYDAGQKAYELTDYDVAIEKFRAAYELIRSSTDPAAPEILGNVIFNLAVVYERSYEVKPDVERLRRARVMYRQYDEQMSTIVPKWGQSAEHADVLARIRAIEARLGAGEKPVEKPGDKAGEKPGKSPGK